MTQQKLPDVDGLPAPRAPSGRCSWCGSPAIAHIEAEKAQYRTNHHGKQALRRPARVAAVCSACRRRLEARYGS